MKTMLEFASDRFAPTSAELDENSPDYINPGVFARALADHIAARLEAEGYRIDFRVAEDWGCWMEVAQQRPYTLAIGCSANADVIGEEGWTTHRVFVEPNRPIVRPVRRLFRQLDVRDDVERLVGAIGRVLAADAHIRGLVLLKR